MLLGAVAAPSIVRTVTAIPRPPNADHRPPQLSMLVLDLTRRKRLITVATNRG